MALADCRGRFRIWSGNIGAHQTGKSSLDYYLRDAPTINKSVLHLLAALDELTLDAYSLSSGSRRLSEDTPHDSDSSATDSSEHKDVHRHSEIQQIFLDISDLLNSLYWLSMSIRNPTISRKYPKALTIDISAFEPYDFEHVRQKFPKASSVPCFPAWYS